MYYSAPYLEEFYARICATAQKITDDFEVIFVNDGSPDNSLDLAVNLYQQDKQRIRVIDLSRNFGHHKAMMAGLSYCKGKYVFLIDVDLEEEPELLGEFWSTLKKKCNEDVDVIYGIQEKRKGGWFEKWSGELYYGILDSLLNIQHPKNITTVRLMTRRYVDALLLHKERELVISGLWIITGFKQYPQIVSKRSTSPTTYSLIHKFSHSVDAITSFSSKPLIFIFFTGLVIFVGAFAYTSYLTVNRIFFSRPLDGWTSIMASVWLLGGIIILFIGVIGIYLSKIFIETKQRPYVIVKDIFDVSSKR
jgi:putative glycosyltransferase